MMDFKNYDEQVKFAAELREAVLGIVADDVVVTATPLADRNVSVGFMFGDGLHQGIVAVTDGNRTAKYLGEQVAAAFNEWRREYEGGE